MNLKETMEAMSELQGWALEGNTLIKNLTLEDFKKAMEFVNKVAEIAERMQHHPYILIKFNVVKLILFTHSTNGLTKIDFDVAKEVDKLN